MKLRDKVIIVTGGAGLLGRTFTTAVIDEGGICIIADKDVKSANNFRDQIQNESVDVISLDITSIESINEMIIAISSKYGKIDAIINNAYPRNNNYGNHFFDVAYEDFCENTNLNLGGYFLTSQQLAKYFLGQGYGNIINIASIYGVIAPKFEIYKGTQMTTPVEYSVIKSGLIHLTRYMANYLRGSNIRINTISPGGILDNQPDSFLEEYKKYTLNKGMLNPQDIVGALIFLLSEDSEFVNGQNIIVDDGFTL